MKNEPNLAIALNKADGALQEGRWNNARQLYQQVLDLEPNHPQAVRKMSDLDRLEETDQKVRDWIQEGDEYLQAGAYREAFDTFTQALNHAAHAGILKYHAGLEQRRNQARDLAAWQKRVQKALKKADPQNREGNWEAAYQYLDSLLEVLPEGSLYEQMAAQVQKARQEAEQQMGADALYKQARAAYKSQAFEQCIRLAEAVPAESSRHQDAQRIATTTKNFLQGHIRPTLQRAEEALQEQRWADAFAELDSLREQFPDSPIWRRHWLRVGMAFGQQELDTGRQANSQHSFNVARRHFERARQAFDKVLEVYRTHTTAQELRSEATDLIQIAAVEAQAQADRQADRHEDACAALEGALRRIERARADGRDYATVAAVVEAMHQALKTEIRHIQEEERRLKDGERLLENDRLSEAVQRFQETLNALSPEHQLRAADGLSRAEEEIRHFKDEMKRGQAASDPSAAVEAFQAAYDRWPTGPSALDALAEGLMQAGRAARDAGREKQAVSYFQRALKLNPDDKQAQLEIERFEVGPRVEAGLEQAQTELDRLLKQPEVSVAGFKALLDHLERVQTQARPHPDLEEPVETLLETVRGRYRQRQAYEQSYRRAVSARQAGEWEQAAEQLSQALSPLGEEVPPALHRRLEDWRAAAQAAQTARQAGPDALQQARDAYDQIPQTGDFSTPLKALSQADELLRRAEEATQAAEGPLPEDLLDLRRRVNDLRLRVELAQEVASSPSARDGWLKVREALRLQGDDPTLEVLARQLEEQVKGEVPDLLKRAGASLEAGDLTEALDLLRQAHELQPEDPEIATRYAGLQRRRTLEERLRQAETDCQSKLATQSPVDAREALRQGIETLLDPEADLSEEARAILLDLTRLGDREEKLALGQDEPWQAAQELLARLGRMGSQNWAARRAAQMADQWAHLAHDIALRGVVASATQLGDLLQAYRAAATLVKGHPTDDEAIQQEASTREGLINQLNESATKRLGRAQEALERGQFQMAIHNLDDIETDFYGPVNQEFPALLDRYDTVEQVRREAAQRKQEAERLQALHAEVRPHLEAAEQAFLEERLDDAERELKAIPDLKEAPYLARRVNDLRERVARTRTDRVRQALQEALTAAQTGLRLATTREQLDRVLEPLESLPEQVDLQALPAEEREPYYQALEQVREQREALVASATWEEEGERALQAGDYVRAAAALEEALEATREGDKRVRLRVRLDEIRDQAARQREREDALRRGRELFDQGEYAQARQELRRAQELGAAVDDQLRAARAGALVASARQAWEAEGDWESAQLELEDALALAKDSPEADEIARSARRFQRRLQQQRETQIALRAELSAADLALKAGDMETAEAQVRAALERVPDHREALELQDRIGRTRQAQEMIQKALEAQKDGKYGEALALVDTVLKTLLPEYPDAVALRQQIQAGRKANEALLQAENLARNDEFQQARQTLQQAVELGADADRLREVQGLVEKRENRWEAEAVDPIRQLNRDGEYAEALSLCKVALEQTASSDFRATLKNLQDDIVNRCAKTDLDKLGERLREITAGETEPAFGNILAELDRLSALEPAPAVHLVREINGLRRQAHTERLRYHLGVARRQADQGDLRSALESLRMIQAEAEDVGLGNIVFQATTMEMDIEEQRRGEEERQGQQRREELLSAAQKLLRESSRSQDLEQARDLIHQVLAMSRFEEDREARNLLEQAETAIRLFDETQAALQRSREQVRLRRFRKADEALRLEQVSPFLKEDHEYQRGLVSLLQRAEREQDQEAWAVALDSYRQAIQQAPSLEPLLEADLERCQQRLMERVVAQAQRALEAAPPEPEKARAILEQAETEGWVTPAFSNTVAHLYDWILSQEHVAQAAHLLEQEDGEPTRVLEMLREARRRLPDGQPDTSIRQWEYLAQAILAWRQGDLERAEGALSAIESPVADIARVQQLQTALHQARHLTRELADIRRQVEEALKDQPPRYKDVVAAVHHALDLGGDDARARQLHRFVQDQLRAVLEGARRAGHYAEAIRLGDALLRLAPDEKEIRDLVAALPDERDEQLANSLRQADEALQGWRLGQAEGALRRADTIAAPDGDPRLNRRREELGRLRQIVEQEVDPRLQEVKELVVRSKWEPAVDHLLQARERASQYPPVVELTEHLKNQLHTEASNHRDDGQFARALDICRLALDLGPRDDLTELQRSIVATRDARLAEQRRQGARALEAWDLETALEALKQGQAIAPDDRELQHLRQRAQEMEAVSTSLQSAMETGWRTLQERDYPAAHQAFSQALETAPHFDEAQAWRDYVINVEWAVQAVENDRFGQAVHLLEAAEGLLRVGGGEQLPSILGGQNRLRERRRQAVYDACRLQQPARAMADLYTQYRQHLTHGAKKLAMEVLARLLEVEKPSFFHAHEALAAPPEDFRIEGLPSAERPPSHQQAAERIPPATPPPSIAVSTPTEPQPPAEETSGLDAAAPTAATPPASELIGETAFSQALAESPPAGLSGAPATPLDQETATPSKRWPDTTSKPPSEPRSGPEVEPELISSPERSAEPEPESRPMRAPQAEQAKASEEEPPEPEEETSPPPDWLSLTNSYKPVPPPDEDEE